MKQTNILKYGVEYAIQNSNIFIKSINNSYNKKEYILPFSENIIYVQGYEPLALDILFNNFYKEDEIKTNRKDIPIIKYTNNNKNSVYYPDIFIPIENKIIEVKSTWTYEKEIEKNNLKREACINVGYNFEFWIFNLKKELV